MIHGISMLVEVDDVSDMEPNAVVRVGFRSGAVGAVMLGGSLRYLGGGNLICALGRFLVVIMQYFLNRGISTAKFSQLYTDSHIHEQRRQIKTMNEKSTYPFHPGPFPNYSSDHHALQT